jgi:hypothetical protein
MSFVENRRQFGRDALVSCLGALLLQVQRQAPRGRKANRPPPQADARS